MEGNRIPKRVLCMKSWAAHVARMGEERGVCRVLLGDTGGKKTSEET